MIYSNSQLRSILNGLGYREKVPVDSFYFPLTSDNSALIDHRTVQAIKKFQQEYQEQLKIDGIAGAQTMAMAEKAINTLQDELNAVVNANLSAHRPFYEPLTVAAVKKLQALISVEQDGIASYSVRDRLYDLTLAAG